MPKERAELLLYQGHCHSDGCPECQFGWGETHPFNEEIKDFRETFNRAMKTVQKYFSYDWGTIIDDLEGIVKTEKEASELISFAEQNIEGAEGIIQLIQCYHGRILFKRKIIFPKWKYGQEKDLIKKLKDSGLKSISKTSDFILEHNLKTYC